MPKKVIVLGGSGMLGSMVVDYLSCQPDLKVAATVRTQALLSKCKERLSAVDWLLLDADAPDLLNIISMIDGYDWLINAIGITKPLIHDNNAIEVERALRINSLLPYRIARRAQQNGQRVLQIATDCVFSGEKGRYTESDEHNPLDVYGKTKSLGEVPAQTVSHLRCSIIGPEPKEHRFLLDWFLGQSRNAGVSGYVNHRWNGVTTLHFAKLCHGIIDKGATLPHLQHVIPSGEVTKYELLRCFAESFHREDISITPTEATSVVDRTLETTNEALNRELWALAGYSPPPSVPEMVTELASFNYRLVGL
ncbi:MAG: SDR family oxidoreductase [Chloroflexi bacterium]|nr:SDR family oxidoreductase [Chloroflexota bacterium]